MRDQTTKRQLVSGQRERKKKIPYHDLDHLFGVWAKEDETSFNKNLELQRKIDKKLWKETK